MIYCAESIEQPYSGQYAEKIYDIESPWNSSDWAWIRFEDENGEWCGQFRGKYRGVAVSEKLEIVIVLTSDYMYTLDINSTEIIEFDSQPDYIDITTSPKGDVLLTDGYDIEILVNNEAGKIESRVVPSFPVNLDNLKFVDWNDNVLKISGCEFLKWDNQLELYLDCGRVELFPGDKILNIMKRRHITMIRRPEMFTKAECGRGKKMGIQILIFFAVFLVNMLLQSLIVTMVQMADFVKLWAQYGGVMDTETIEIITEELMAMQYTRPYLLLSLFLTVTEIAAAMIYCRFIEKRSLQSMGFVKKHALRDYLVGLLVGFLLFSLIVLLNVLTGAMSVQSMGAYLTSENFLFIGLFFVGFVIQGAAEEILVRGYLMTSLGSKHKLWVAVAMSSAIFALLHIFNPGITFLSLINLFLAGVSFGLYVICFDNIWGACAYHTMWNFVQGNFYGIQVSGMTMSDSVLVTTNTEGMELLNGGSFGAEGGLITTLVLLAFIGGLLLYMKKTGKINMRQQMNV